MHWLKTKIKHILYNNFTDREFTKFMKIRALTCQLGEIPKDYQIATVCPQKTYESICKRLANEGQTLREVLVKDIEDASEVEEKREYWKRNKRQQREKTKVVHKDGLGLSQQEIRVDKIREDNNSSSYIDFYINNFNKDYKHSLQTHESNELHLIGTTYKEDEIINAMKVCVERNKKNIGYLKGVLNNKDNNPSEKRQATKSKLI